jgi:hypothetical protein
MLIQNLLMKVLISIMRQEKKQRKKLIVAQELQSTESIFDFFYIDTWKIKSFYAQLTGNGAITTFKNVSNISDGRQMEASAGIPMTAMGKGGSSHTASTGSEHLYDAAPTMPREMINKLDEMGYISRELEREQLGSLVLLKGILGIADMTVIQAVVEPLSKNLFANIPEKNAIEKKQKKDMIEKIKPAFELLQKIPYALEARLLVHTGDTGENGIPYANEVWMTLSRNEMVGGTHDLNFKHGEFMPGDWYVLGILDAIPHDGFTWNTENNEIKEFMAEIAKTLKEQFGRPSTSFGMTPIAIFRVLKPKSK